MMFTVAEWEHSSSLVFFACLRSPQRGAVSLAPPSPKFVKIVSPIL
jgi:hypothetical protein